MIKLNFIQVLYNNMYIRHIILGQNWVLASCLSAELLLLLADNPCMCGVLAINISHNSRKGVMEKIGCNNIIYINKNLNRVCVSVCLCVCVCLCLSL